MHQVNVGCGLLLEAFWGESECLSLGLNGLECKGRVMCVKFVIDRYCHSVHLHLIQNKPHIFKHFLITFISSGLKYW